jgi:hypothetical protein
MLKDEIRGAVLLGIEDYWCLQPGLGAYKLKRSPSPLVFANSYRKQG